MTAKGFKQSRAILGFTQAQLAEQLDLDERQVRRYERGEAPIPRTVMFAMSWLRAINNGIKLREMREHFRNIANGRD